MSWHNCNPIKVKSVKDFEAKILETLTFTKDLEKTCMSTSFSHIFQGGYSAGYYSYKWAEVLSSDAFSLFEEQGIFDSDASLRFQKNILEKGGSEDAMDLFVAFRGREPKIEPLLRHSGISKQTGNRI